VLEEPGFSRASILARPRQYSGPYRRGYVLEYHRSDSKRVLATGSGPRGLRLADAARVDYFPSSRLMTLVPEPRGEERLSFGLPRR
jgi:hypothetical protein